MVIYSIIQKSQLEGALRLDAEYYQPEYLELQKKLFSTKLYKLWGELSGKFITGPFGSEFNIDNYDSESKYRYIRGKDVKEFFIQENDNVYIPKKDFERLKKYSLKEGDILTSVVGTPGLTAIVDQSIIPSIFSCKSTVFRSADINSNYFIAYLNSKYGYKLLQRSIRGALQTGLNIDDLKSLPIFIPDENTQNNIAEIVKKTKQEFQNSKSLYAQAEDLLLEELGLKNFESKNELWSVVNLSEVRKANRIDAEYFQSKYDILISKIKNNSKPLEIFIKEYSTGFPFKSENYQEAGIPLIRINNIKKEGIDLTNATYLSNKDYLLSPKDTAKAGDIVLSMSGSIGLSALIPEKIPKCSINQRILKISTKNINKNYLVLLLNSIIGKLQLDRIGTGGVQTNISYKDIKNMLIPILSEQVQQKTAELVNQSHEARKKAKELLEEAKRKVEKMIEEEQK